MKININSDLRIAERYSDGPTVMVSGPNFDAMFAVLLPIFDTYLPASKKPSSTVILEQADKIADLERQLAAAQAVTSTATVIQ